MSAKHAPPFSPASFDARLVLYTTAGAGLLLFPGVAHAQTVYHDPTDYLLYVDSPNTVFDGLIDLNGDSVTDFIAKAEWTNTNERRTDVVPLAFTRFVKSSFSPFLSALTAGTSIGSASEFDAPAYATLRMKSGATEFGDWPENTDRYIGVEFKIGAATHYGWVRAQTNVDGAFAFLVIQDWAYNATAGEAIIAGHTSSSSAVPEPSSLALFAAGGAAALGLLRRRRSVA